MNIPAKIKGFLEKNRVKYEIVEHKTVYTAYDKAATLKIKPNIIGKTLIIKFGKEIAFILIPGNKNLDLKLLKKTLKTASKIDFVGEKWMKNNLKGIKLGAAPPFGILWKFKTFADRNLLKNPKIIINSGIHEISLKITPAEFKKHIPNLIVSNFGKAKK